MKYSLLLMGLLIASISVSYVYATPAQMQAGAIAYFSLDNISTTATQALGSTGGNATRINQTVSSVQGKVGEAMQFNGSSGYLYGVLNKTYNASSTGGFSVNIWINMNGSSAATSNSVFWSMSSPGPSVNTQEYAGAVNSFFDMNDGGDSFVGPLNYSTAGTWHMFTAVRRQAGTEMDIYQDGLLANNSTVVARNLGVLSSLTVWATPGNGTSDKTKVIDEVGFFNYSLDNSEVSVLWNSGNGIAWPFNNLTNTQNFSITLQDQYDSTFINSFNASVQYQNGTIINYTTTTGQINTTFALNGSQVANVTISSNNYFNTTYYNYVLSSGLSATIFQAQVQFNASEIITAFNISNFTVRTPNGLIIPFNGSLYIRSGTYNLTFNRTGWYNASAFNIVIPALYNGTQNFSYVFRYLLNVTALNSITGIKENIFTINATSGNYPTYNTIINTTNGSALIPWINDTNFNLSLYNAVNISMVSILYNTSNFTQQPAYINITLTSVTTNTIAFSVYNETTQTILTVNTTIQLSGSLGGYNYTTSTGTVNATLITPDTYIITVSAAGYTTRQYIKTLTNQTTNALQLFLIPTGYGTLLISDLDKTYKSLPGYQNSLLRLNATSSNVFEVERCRGDINGQCLVSAQICTTSSSDCAFYKIIVYDTSGNLVGDTGLKKLSDNTFPIVINNANPVGSVLNYFGSSQYLSSIDPATGIVYYYVDNNNGLGTNFILTLQRRIGTSYATLETVSTSSVGTIVLNTSGTNTSIGDEFIANAYYTDSSGQIHLGATKSYSPPTGGLGASKSSAINFVGLGLVIAPLTLFTLSPPLSIAGAIAMLFIINFTGLTTFTTTAIGGITVIGAIVIWRFFT